MERFYPTGTPGEPWTDVQKREWFDARTIQRSSADEVLTPPAWVRFDVTGVVDAQSIFGAYRMMCEEQGVSHENMIVIGGTS